jgi:hypothetical protein
MKKLIILSLIVAITLVSCADHKVINGRDIRPYGFLNQGTEKDDSIYYEPSGWALFSGIFFIECIAPPIYVFGYNFYEPKMSMKEYREMKGIK